MITVTYPKGPISHQNARHGSSDQTRLELACITCCVIWSLLATMASMYISNMYFIQRVPFHTKCETRTIRSNKTLKGMYNLQWNDSISDVASMYSSCWGHGDIPHVEDMESQRYNTVHTLLFITGNFRPSLLTNSFAPSWIHPEIIWDIRNSTIFFS